MRDPRRFQEIRAEAESLAAALARDLEEAGDDPGAVDGLFRTAHSLKGFASLLDAAEAVRLADAIEDALDELRAGRIAPGPELRRALHRAIDRCQVCLAGGAGDEAILEGLRAARAAAALPSGPDPLDALELPAFVREALTDHERARAGANLRRGLRLHRIFAGFALADFDARLEEARARIAEAGELVAALPAQGEGEISFELLAASSLDAAALAARLGPLARRIEPVDRRAGREGRAAPPERVRVEVAALREVEAALAALRAAAGPHTDALAPALARLEAGVRRLGWTTAAELAARAGGMVEALARAWDRPARLVVEGGAVEVPVLVAEALGEPLLHLVRNALDHGIEAPGERRRRGKPNVGTIRLAFARTAAGLVVEVADDGAGIDEARLAAAARAAGHTVAGDPLALAFLPGVSTAQAGGRSGRGVGLDAVQAALAALGGRATVRSAPGAGATFVLEVPIRA